MLWPARFGSLVTTRGIESLGGTAFPFGKAGVSRAAPPVSCDYLICFGAIILKNNNNGKFDDESGCLFPTEASSSPASSLPAIGFSCLARGQGARL